MSETADAYNTLANNEATTGPNTMQFNNNRSWKGLMQFLLEGIAVILIVVIVIKAVEDDKPASTITTILDSTTAVSNTSHSSVPMKPRMITREELATKNGENSNDNTTLWLSMMSEVFDVSSAPHFYGVNATYHIFAGRDGNVPFVTGVFTDEEAAKPITNLTQLQVWSLETFLNDTYRYNKNANYTFVGLLIGDLYFSDGSPTPIMLEVRRRIAEETIIKAEEKRKREQILQERRQKDFEKKESEQRAAEKLAAVSSAAHGDASAPITSTEL
jgi:Cytochrome b5-like Heme/Steroid binding domain